MTIVRFASLLFLILPLVVAGGCGDGRGVRIPISGVVTVDGQPLQHGSVTFNPIKGAEQKEKQRAGGGSLNAEGKFQVSSFTANDGLMVGKYEVSVLALEPLGPNSQKWHAPQKYSNFKTSGLTYEITPETESIEFKLTWEGEDPSEPYVEEL